jgi:putative ABC transport system substrate-binding protein
VKFIIVALFLALAVVAEAQQVKKVPRIGYLGGTPLPARAAAFEQGLRELGYVNGRTILVEYRYTEGNADRYTELAAELVRLKVEIIVSAGSTATRGVKDATSIVPIVMTQDSDPVGNGFVSSLARPGGNITGLSTLAPELRGKQLEVLKEIVPRVARLAVFETSTQPGTAQAVKEVERAASAFAVKLEHIDILNSMDFEKAFRAAGKTQAEAVIMMVAGRVAVGRRSVIADLAIKNRLPVIYPQSEYVEAGGLVSYGASEPDLDRRAAVYVDKILKGAKPADLPVEQPTKFELVINLKAAKQIGLTIPPNVLARADRVIK